MPRNVPCSDVPLFILLAFRYFMARTERKTGSPNDSKSTQPCWNEKPSLVLLEKVHDSYTSSLLGSAKNP